MQLNLGLWLIKTPSQSAIVKLRNWLLRLGRLSPQHCVVMYRLRDELISPPRREPTGLESPMRLSSDREREDVRRCIDRGESDEVRGAAFYNRTWYISDRYCNIGDGVNSLEDSIHSLWNMYYQLSQHTSHANREHDRLVLDIVRIQGLGPLTRPVSGLYGVDKAHTSDGLLWDDMPFLATDMTNCWINDCSSMSGSQRVNCASFLAKVASARVCEDRLCQIALVLFRETFEVGRKFGATNEPDDEDPTRSIRALDIVHLLPSAVMWIQEANSVLGLLSDACWNDCPGSTSYGGEEFIKSDLGKRSPSGFTPWRWMYWLRRLHEIRDEARAAREQRIEGYANDAIHSMITSVESRNMEILRAYKGGGEILQQDQNLSCLKSLGHP